MAVEFTQLASATAAGSATSITLSHTLVSTRPIIFVGFHNAAGVISNIRWNTFISTFFPVLAIGPVRNGEFTGYLYKLAASVGAGTLTVNFSQGVSQRCILLAEFSDLNPSDVLVDQQGSTGNSSTPSVVVAGETGGLVMDFLYVAQGSFFSKTAPMTPNGGQTQRFSTSLGFNVEIRASTKTAASSVTMGWTMSNPGQGIMIAASLRPLSSPPPPGPTNQKQQMVL